VSAHDGEDLLAAWLQDNPGGKAWEDRDGCWHGAVPVDTVRSLHTGPCVSPSALLAVLTIVMSAAAEVRLIEKEHPGWLARRWSDGRWSAGFPRGEDEPLYATAPDGPSLRAAIRRAMGGPS